MPAPPKLVKAEIQAIRWVQGQDQPQDLQFRFPVQFNPETLKLSFANQTAGGDQTGGGSTQVSGRGTTKLAFDLWFDVTAPPPDTQQVDDVRRLTDQLVYFFRPLPESDNAPPGVRLLWGTFLFEGRFESINETLELFSEDGRPLRASVSVSLVQQEILKIKERSSGGPGNGPGTVPAPAARAGDSVQSVAARLGRPDDWPAIAAANGIENPRRLQAGLSLNVQPPRAAVKVR